MSLILASKLDQDPSSDSFQEDPTSSICISLKSTLNNIVQRKIQIFSTHNNDPDQFQNLMVSELHLIF